MWDAGDRRAALPELEDELLDALFLIGTVDPSDRIEAHRAAGYTTVAITPIAEDGRLTTAIARTTSEAVADAASAVLMESARPHRSPHSLWPALPHENRNSGVYGKRLYI